MIAKKLLKTLKLGRWKKKGMCSNKARREIRTREITASWSYPQGNPDPEMGEGLKTQIWWIDRKELANTFTC